MDEFASAFFVALIEAALSRQGLSVPVRQTKPTGSQKVALSAKKALVQGVLARHGPAALLRVGLGLPQFAHTPVADIFAPARDPHDLFDRWCRMERYFHSRHRIDVEHRGPNAVTFRHAAASGPAPSAAEDIVVAGMLAALVERIGATGVSLVCDDGVSVRQAIVADQVVADRTLSNADTARWQLSWEAFQRVRPVPRPIEPPVRSANGRSLRGDHVRKVFERVAADPTARLTVKACATDLGLSSRGLQRRLAAEDNSFQEIIALARLQTAADLLAHTDNPPSLIGLLAGYTDQPHFNRAFRKGMAMTPVAYRKLVR